ncbi:MAG TPA: thioredoxin domain-containing protein, partial [Thermoanaerobaculia bacterium]|nr:thioredoxin domain-containing protein [Thermoanaerobaculia bacterium]
MKRSLLALVTLLAATSLSAQALDQAALRKYVERTLPRCPAATLSLDHVPETGPANFDIWAATLRSSDQYCGTQKYVLFSPRTQQVLIGTIIPLPPGTNPIQQRISSHTSQLLKSQITATVAPFPLPDGLKSVNMTRQTEFGPFSYHGFLDASEQFLIVGLRGSLKAEPATIIRDSLGASNAVRRGNKDSKVEIIEVSDFQCPTCARAHKMLEPIISKNLAKVNYARLDLPLFEHHEWAVPAAMGARAIQRVAPAKYWEYVDYVFTNQEAIGKMKFDTFYKGWIEDHDIDWKAVEKIYTSKQEQTALLEQVSRAFDAGINSTPTLIINGQILGFGPEGTFTINAVKQALGIKETPAAPAKKAPAKKAPAK